MNFKTFSAQLSNIISKMWPSTGNKKSATISGWQALGDFASVKQQLQKIRASTRVSSSKKSQADQGGPMYSQGGARPLPPLPGGGCPQNSNKSVRFSLPSSGGPFIHGSEGSGSDQGYESDQSRVRQSLLLADFNASVVNSQERRMRMEQPGLLSKLTNFRHKLSEESSHHPHYGQSSTLTRSGHSGTLTRYGHKEDHLYYGPVKNIGESDRDMSSSSPVLLEMYDHVKVRHSPLSLFEINLNQEFHVPLPSQPVYNSETIRLYYFLRHL